MRIIPLQAAAILLAVMAPLPCWAAQPPGEEAGISLQGAWMRFIVPSRPAAGYFALRNASDATKSLTGAQSPACGELMLHRSLQQGGLDRMEMVASVAVPAGGSLSFAPGGYHLMCLQPGPAMRPGAHVPVTLRFGDGGTLTSDFAVEGADGHG